MKLIGSGRSMSGLESVLRTQIRHCAKSEKVPPIAAIPEGGRLSEPLAHRCRIYTEKAAGYAGGSPLRTAFRRYRGRSSLARNWRAERMFRQSRARLEHEALPWLHGRHGATIKAMRTGNDTYRSPSQCPKSNVLASEVFTNMAGRRKRDPLPGGRRLELVSGSQRASLVTHRITISLGRDDETAVICKGHCRWSRGDGHPLSDDADEAINGPDARARSDPDD